MDYGWINSKTEHMGAFPPPLCLPCSCERGLLGRTSRDVQGRMEQTWGLLPCAPHARPGARGHGECSGTGSGEAAKGQEKQPGTLSALSSRAPHPLLHFYANTPPII